MNQELIQCAKEAALQAGIILKDAFGTNFQIDNKVGANDLVTEFDHKAEDIIISIIKKRFPDHYFLAEESGKTGNEVSGKIRWIIDPIDGTVNFAHNIPIFSISIAAELDGEILCGAIYHPMQDELFLASKGNGATLNGKPIKVSDKSDYLTSFLVTGFPYDVADNPCSCVDIFVDVIRKGIPIRRLGSAALDLAYVACGRFDGFWEIGLKPWDVAAGILLVREAGGKVSQFNKKDYFLGANTMLASNGNIHNSVIEHLDFCDTCGEKHEN